MSNVKIQMSNKIPNPYLQKKVNGSNGKQEGGKQDIKIKRLAEG